MAAELEFKQKQAHAFGPLWCKWCAGPGEKRPRKQRQPNVGGPTSGASEFFSPKKGPSVEIGFFPSCWARSVSLAGGDKLSE